MSEMGRVGSYWIVGAGPYIPRLPASLLPMTAPFRFTKPVGAYQ
jgi:hypothetical protein